MPAWWCWKAGATRPCAWHSNSTNATVADLRETEAGSSRRSLCLRVFGSNMCKRELRKLLSFVVGCRAAKGCAVGVPWRIYPISHTPHARETNVPLPSTRRNKPQASQARPISSLLRCRWVLKALRIPQPGSIECAFLLQRVVLICNLSDLSRKHNKYGDVPAVRSHARSTRG